MGKYSIIFDNHSISSIILRLGKGGGRRFLRFYYYQLPNFKRWCFFFVKIQILKGSMFIEKKTWFYLS